MWPWKRKSKKEEQALPDVPRLRLAMALEIRGDPNPLPTTETGISWEHAEQQMSYESKFVAFALLMAGASTSREKALVEARLIVEVWHGLERVG